MNAIRDVRPTVKVRSLIGWTCYSVVVGLIVSVACTPAQRAAVPTIEKDACILLRLAGDPTINSVCATADDLAPFIPTIIASQKEEADAGHVSQPMVAFAMPISTKRPPAKRHCTTWIYVDAGKD